MDIQEILKLHKQWLNGVGGKLADLRGVDLRGVDLRGANLRGADLRGADLRGANLSGANLRGADLRGANLSWANLREANLSWADLSGADLSGADLRGADLREAKNCDHARAETCITPEGTIIGYKICNNGVIVRLEIPETASRSNATGRKCRAEYVRVLEVYGAEFGVTDTHGPVTEYRAGEIVRANKWDPDWKNECSGGIHFFLTRAEAERF